MVAALLLAWGVVVGLDLVSVAQTMVSRPLVAGIVAGSIAGDLSAGAAVGVVLELFAVDTLPVGASRYPEYGLGAVAAVATAAGAPIVFGLGPGIAVGLVVAMIGDQGFYITRMRNSADVRAHRDALNAGDVHAISGVHLRGLARDAVRAFLVTGIGLALALSVREFTRIPVGVTLYMAIAVIGAALAAAFSGALRLTGRSARLRWFTFGLIGGAVGVAFL